MQDTIEKNVEAKLEQIDPTLYDEAMIPSLSAAILVYLKAFSKPPFEETWESSDPNFEFTNDEYLLPLIQDVLSNPQDLQIEGSLQSQKMTYKGKEIKTKYPLSSIVNAYAKAIDNPNATLVVKAGESIYDLSVGERIPNIDVPKASATVRLVNYLPTERNVPSEISKEVEAYVSDEENEALLNALENSITVYLAEIANLRSKQKDSNPFTIVSLSKYLSKYGNSLPQQIVFMTKTGTSIENEDRGNASFLKPILRFAYPGKSIDSSVLKFNEGKTIIYIFKVESEQQN